MSSMSGDDDCLFNILRRRVIKYLYRYVEMPRKQYESVIKERPSSPPAQVLDLLLLSLLLYKYYYKASQVSVLLHTLQILFGTRVKVEHAYDLIFLLLVKLFYENSDKANY